jgi:elongation factor Ts
MATIDAGTVKKLREMTSAGIMDCKRALNETGGDLDAAVTYLREKGMASVGKKAGRATSEGAIGVSVSADGHKAGIVELNCETDFVARNDQFRALVNRLAEAAQDAEGSLEAFNAQALEDGRTVQETIAEAIATLGENMQVSRVEAIHSSGTLGSYIHSDGKQAAIVAVESESPSERVSQLARDLAMQAVAMRPQYLHREEVPQNVIDAERAIYEQQAAQEGKPEAIQTKIAEGRLNKEFFQAVALMEQPFIREQKQTIKQVVKDIGGNARPSSFVRYSVGETQAAE